MPPGHAPEPEEILRRLAAREEDDTVLTAVRTFPARTPNPEPFPADLPELLTGRLRLRNVEGLYGHQAEGVEALRGGRNLIMTTGTASGKSLVYQIAIAEAILTVPKATALCLFPTKALARDQLRSLRSLRMPQLKASVYDGDTPRAERPLIRSRSNVVLSNPDMLHAGILPDHARWADFLHRLEVVVIDEAHVCRGVFGSQVAMVLRRLRRLVERAGGRPRWCLASATIGNPGELARRLTGLSFDEVTADRSPSGRKVFALWNPPINDEDTGERRSALGESSRIVGELVGDGVRTIAFARSRRAAELLTTFARRQLGSGNQDLAARIKTYRAGYLAEDRRRIERELADGELVAVAATSALELGIDIGSLDAAVLTGYPGTRASLWQQAGRAGRREGASLAVLVAQDDPLDQYLVAHPEDLFDRPAEAATIDPTNPYVLGPHLRCAASESPLGIEELGAFGDAEHVGALVEDLVVRGQLVRRGDRFHDALRTDPHREVDIRGGGNESYAIVIENTGELLGTTDAGRAYATLHPGAVYLHQGEQYLVDGLDLVDRVALVRSADPDYYTQARDVTDIALTSAGADRVEMLGEVQMSLGIVRVSRQVVGYARKLVSTGELLDEINLALPPSELETMSVWWTIPGSVIGRAGIAARDLPGAIHAAEHAAIGLLPLVATCDRWDIGGVSTPMHPDTGATTIFIHDAYPGGAGITERGFEEARRWLGATLETVRACPCGHGCPSCVQSPKCGNGNEPLDKAGAVALLAAMLR
jgi:DEAD/DEAH box helicase domain-containing protein